MPARNSRGECYDGSHGTRRTARADEGADCEKCGKHEEIVVKMNDKWIERLEAGLRCRGRLTAPTLIGRLI